MAVEHLKPHQFKPGQTGNRGGRPKAAIKLAEMIRAKTRDGADLVEFWLSVKAGDETGMTDDKSRRWATDKLAEYGFGKPRESVEVIQSDAATMPDMRGKSLAELREIAGRPTVREESAPDEPSGTLH